MICILFVLYLLFTICKTISYTQQSVIVMITCKDVYILYKSETFNNTYK